MANAMTAKPLEGRSALRAETRWAEASCLPPSMRTAEEQQTVIKIVLLTL
jgi:hypothetical protein